MLRKLYKCLKIFPPRALFMLLMVFCSYAQNPSSAELMNQIKNSSPNEAKTYEKTLLSLNLKDKEIFETYLDVGYNFYKKEDYNRSEYYFDLAIQKAIVIKDDNLLSKAYFRLGNALLLNWKNQLATDAYYKSIEHSKKAKDINREKLALTNIALILRRLKQYDKALEICNSASKGISEDKNLINLITIKCETHLDLKQLDSAMYSANRGIEMSKKLNYHAGLFDLYVKKGIIYCLKKDFENSWLYLSKAEKVINDNAIKSNKFLINLKYAKAKYFYEKEAYDKSILLLLNVVELFGEPINPRKGRVLDTHLLLAKSYKEIDLLDESNEWYYKFTLLSEQFQENQALAVDKIYKKDTENLGIEIKGLKSDKLKSKKNYVYLLIASSIGILTLLIFIIGFRRKQKSNKTLLNNLLEKITVLETPQNKTSSNNAKEIVINDAKVNAIVKRLNKLEEQEYYLSTNCNLRSIAKKVKSNATYLSRIINTHKNKNYNDYINDLRIDYTIKRLKNNKQFRSFSIKSIATEVGYKSDYSFAKHFKSKTGLNPSYYIKEINKLNAK